MLSRGFALALVLIACNSSPSSTSAPAQGSQAPQAPSPTPKAETCADRLRALATTLRAPSPLITPSTERSHDRTIDVPCKRGADDEACKTAAETATKDKLAAEEKVGGIRIVDGDRGARVAKAEILSAPRPSPDVGVISAPVKSFDPVELERVEQVVRDAGLKLMLQNRDEPNLMYDVTVTCPRTNEP